MDRYDPYTDKFLRDTQYDILGTDCISRKAAIMDAESWVAVDEYEKHLQKNVVEWLKEFPPAELGTNLAEVGTEERTEEHTETHACDCISRQAAIDALKDATFDFEACEIVLKQLPPVTPKQRWTPVTERLPEELVEVNVTWVNHEPEIYYSDDKDKPFVSSAVLYRGKWYWMTPLIIDWLSEYGERCGASPIARGIEITAWQEKPEPWEGEEK